MMFADGACGDRHFLVAQGGVSIGDFVAFLECLIKSAGRKIIVVAQGFLDDFAQHLATWLSARREEIEFFCTLASQPNQSLTRIGAS
jgi:hypothetical protein